MRGKDRGRRNSYVKKYDPDVRLDWQEKAACRDQAPDFDYEQKAPPKVQADNPRPRKMPENVSYALQICVFECKVREQCLEFALRIEVPSGRQGIYGGTTPNERDALYAERLEQSA